MSLPDGGSAPPEARAKALAATLARTLRRHASKGATGTAGSGVSLVVATGAGEVEIDLSTSPVEAGDSCRADLCKIPGLEILAW